MTPVRWGLLGLTIAAFTTFVAPAAAEPQWSPCPDGVAPGAQCATVSVPMDYSKPSGARIDVLVSRIPASGRRVGVLFGNPGGPGGSALDLWSKTREVYPAQLHAQFDLVAVQPRGLTWSTPLTCEHTCPAGYAATITTENTARDMDEVRQALGFDRISFMGTSYGTYLGAVYASLFGEHVDKMVLDSNVNPNWVWRDEFVAQQTARVGRLLDLFDWVAANDAVYHLGATREAVWLEWSKQLTAEGNGLQANVSRELSGEGALASSPFASLVADRLHLSAEQIGRLANITRLFQFTQSLTDGTTGAATATALYARRFWPYFAQGLAEVRRDPANTRLLTALADAEQRDDAAAAVFDAITCNENAIPEEPALLPRALGELALGGDFSSAAADFVRAGLLCYGAAPVVTPVRIDASALATRPLLLQSDRDAATSAVGGAAMAAAVGGHLIRVTGGDHGLFGRGSADLDTAVMRYLTTGEVAIEHAEQAPITTPNPPP